MRTDRASRCQRVANRCNLSTKALVRALTTNFACATVQGSSGSSRATFARHGIWPAADGGLVITKRTLNTKDEPYRDGKQRYEARVRGPNGRVITRTFRTQKAG